MDGFISYPRTDNTVYPASLPLLARDLNTVPIGTMGHEYLQTFQALGMRLRDFQRAAEIREAVRLYIVGKSGKDWIARGVKNMTGIPRPVPYELDLQIHPDFPAFSNRFGMSAVEFSGIWVKLGYASLFTAVLLAVGPSVLADSPAPLVSAVEASGWSGLAPAVRVGAAGGRRRHRRLHPGGPAMSRGSLACVGLGMMLGAHLSPRVRANSANAGWRWQGTG